MNPAIEYMITEFGRSNPYNARREMVRRLEWWTSKNNVKMADMYDEYIKAFDDKYGKPSTD